MSSLTGSNPVVSAGGATRATKARQSLRERTLERGHPREDPTARKLDDIDYETLLNLDLKVMDATAASLSRNTNMPIIVFDFAQPENIKRIVYGEQVGTLVRRRSS